MTDHFEDLWCKCEAYHQANKDDTSVLMLISELIMKLNLYNAIEQRTELTNEDRYASKSRIAGEILLALTHLSLKDDINVFDALNVALQYRANQLR